MQAQNLSFDFFDHAQQVKGLTFDSEEFCKYLAFHDRNLRDDINGLGFFFESFLNPENIKKSSRFSMGENGFEGKMIIKSDSNVIKIFAIIDKEGNPFVKIGVNDSVKEFTDKESLISSLSRFGETFFRTLKYASSKVAVDFQSAFNDFMKYCHGLLEKRFEQHQSKGNKWHFVLEPMNGSKYIRLVEGSMLIPENETPPKSLSNFTSRSAWAFIDKTNGDVLKPATWAAPAKHARANIFDKSTWKNVTEYGPAYLR